MEEIIIAVVVGMIDAFFHVLVDYSGIAFVEKNEEEEEVEVDAVDDDKVEKRVVVDGDEEDVGIEKNMDQASSMYYYMVMMQEVLRFADA